MKKVRYVQVDEFVEALKKAVTAGTQWHLSHEIDFNRAKLVVLTGFETVTYMSPIVGYMENDERQSFKERLVTISTEFGQTAERYW